jgi:hypothetical protein
MNFIGDAILAYSFGVDGEPADWRILDYNFQEIYRQKNSQDQLYGFGSYNGLEKAANYSESETMGLGRSLYNLGFKSTIFAIKRTRFLKSGNWKKNIRKRVRTTGVY